MFFGFYSDTPERPSLAQGRPAVRGYQGVYRRQPGMASLSITHRLPESFLSNERARDLRCHGDQQSVIRGVTVTIV